MNNVYDLLSSLTTDVLQIMRNKNKFLSPKTWSSPLEMFFSSVPSSLPRTTPNYLHHPQIICTIQILLISVWLTQQTHVFWFAQSCSKRRNIYNYLNNWWWVISYSRTEFVECTHYIRTLMNICIVLASEDATFSVCI